MFPNSDNFGSERNTHTKSLRSEAVSTVGWGLVGLRLIGAITVGATSTVVIGWLLHLRTVTSLLPGLPSMKFNTAAGLGLLGLTLVLLTIKPPNRRSANWPDRVALILSLLVWSVAALTCLQIILERSFGIDELLVKDWLSRSGLERDHPGRMSPATAVSLLLLSSALAACSVRIQRKVTIAILRTSACAAAGIGTVTGLSMLMTQHHLANFQFFSTMALHTAWLTCLLGIATLGLGKARLSQTRENDQRSRTRGGLWLAVSVALALAAGLVITTIEAQRASTQEHEAGQARFDHLSDLVVAEATRRVYLPVYGLKGGRGMYAASDDITRENFRDYVESRDLPSEFPGTIGIGFIKKVIRDDLDTFLMNERSDDAPDFRIKTSGDYDTLYPIVYIDPLEANRPAWGYDVGSEFNRRAAVERAIRTGEPTLTARLSLVQDEQVRPGFLFLVPVYQNGSPTSTEEERTQSLRGIIYSAMVIDRIFDGVLDIAEDGLGYRVFEGLTNSDESLLHEDLGYPPRADGSPDNSLHRSRFSRLNQVAAGGRLWTIETMSTPKFESTAITSQSPTIALYGLILSTVVACFVWVMGHKSQSH